MSRQTTPQHLSIFEGNGGTDRTDPKPFEVTARQTQVTYGDGHGNALLQIDILRLNHFLEISKEDYEELAEIYFLTAKKYAPILAKYIKGSDGLIYRRPADPKKQARALTYKERRKYKRSLKQYDQAIHNFAAIIDRCKVKSNADLKRLFRSLGDLFSDRGANDLFTLCLFFKLYPSDVSLEALLGNHDQLFLYHWATNFKNRSHTSIKEAQSCSYSNLFDLIEHGVVSKNAVDNLIQNYYLPTLRLISYSTSDQPERSLSIFTHAPVKDPLLIVQSLAKHYFPAFTENELQVDTREKVTTLIDKINAEFQKRLLEEDGKAEFIKIQEQFINPKLTKRDEFRSKEAIVDQHTKFYQDISNILSNSQESNEQRSRITQLRALVAKVLNIEYSKEENRTTKNLWKAINLIAPKLPPHIFNKLEKDFKEKTTGVADISALEILTAEIFSIIPVELIRLMLEYKPETSHFDLKNILASFPEIKQKVTEENPDDERLLRALEEIESKLNLFKIYELEYQQKIHGLNYEYGPFAALLWEHFEERPEEICPKTLEDGTLLYSVHGHDSKKPEDNIKPEENRFDLNSNLGKAAPHLIQSERKNIEKCLAAFNHCTSSNYTGYSRVGQAPEKIGPAQTYINSDQHPKEPEIVTQHRDAQIKKKLDAYLPICKNYLETLHGIQDFKGDKTKILIEIEGVVTKANETLNYQDPPQAQLEAAPSPANQEPVILAPSADQVTHPAPRPQAPSQELRLYAQELSETLIFRKTVAINSLIAPLKNEPLAATMKLREFDAQFGKAETQLSSHRDFLPRYPKIAIFLMVSLTIITGLLAGLVILGLAIHSKITRNTFNILRANGALFSEQIKSTHTLKETLFNPTSLTGKS